MSENDVAKSPERLMFLRLTGRAFQWIWQAAQREFLVTLVAQAIGAGALALVLLCGRRLALDLTEGELPESVIEVFPSVLCLAAALFVSGVCRVIQQEGRIVVGELLVHHLQREVIDVAASVDYERFEEQNFNDLRDRATTEGPNNALQMVYDILALVSSLTTSVSLCVVLAATVPTVLPLLVLVAVPFVIAARASARLAFRTAYELTPSDRLRWSLFWALVGKEEAKEVRVFDLHHSLSRRWAELFEERSDRVRRVAARRTLFNGLASIASSLLVAGLLVVIVMAAIDGELVVADAAIAIVALQQMAGRIRGTANSSGSLREAALFLDDFEQFRSHRKPEAAPTSKVDAPDGVEPLPAFSKLRVEGVEFIYPGTERVVLSDIDLEIGPGEIVALVGASGSGKSTLAHLVAGLYRPTSGRITWDGIDISTMDRATYWRSLAVVYQDFVRYPLTARENIGISDHRRLDDAEAIAGAAHMASIGEVIEHLPLGYESMMSRTYDDGVELSGGEWQRIAVARAFFREAPFVILDEPAAALDAMAERELYEHLTQLCVDRSALLISHRFSTVRMADRIYVLQDGRVVEHGSHEALITQDGHYAAMFHVQAAGYVDSA